jgi:hypothetical protein
MCTVDLTPFCAGHFWPSDQRRPVGSCEQAQRVADPSSQPPASRRSIGAWWPDEESALSWPIPMVIDRMRRGTHVRADATGPCRGCATAVSCRAASCMSRRPCPRPVCCAHCTSVAQTCRAALRVTRQLLPRSPTDVPAPSGRQTCRMHPEHLLQAASGSHSGL